MAINVDFQDTDYQSIAGKSITISVVLTDNNGTVLNNAPVNFTTNPGVIAPYSTFTNSLGVATISLNYTGTGTVHVNASSGNFSNTTNVTLMPAEISSIAVIPNTSVNTAGKLTNISFYAFDKFGNANTSEVINLKIIASDVLNNALPETEISLSPGNISLLELNSTSSAITDTGIPSDRIVLLVNCTVAGNISINSTSGSVSNITYLDIISGPPSFMRVVYNDDYTVNSSSSFYVSVQDTYENPVENVNLSFNATAPENTIYNSPLEFNSASLGTYNGSTDLTGKYSNIFTTDKRAGDNIVSVSAVNTSLSLNITITGLADNIDNLLLSYTPEKVIANNQDSYVLSACPTDQFRNPIIPLTTPIKEQVRFTTGSGNVVLVPLNSQGRANIVAGPTPYIESLSVNATYRNESGYTAFTNSTTLDFVAGPLSLMYLYSMPDTVLSQDLNGNHESAITLIALDQWGHSLPDINVTFVSTNTTVGTLTIDGKSSADIINATTDSEGRIYGVFTAGNSGNSSVIATSDNISCFTNLSVKDDPFLSVNLSISPLTVNSGSLINVTTVISVEGELPITRPAASAMLVLDRSGSMDPDYYAGTPIDVVLVLDRSGSMAGTPLSNAKEAAKEFTDNLVSNCEVGIVSFSESSGVDLGMTLMTSYSSKTPVNDAIDSINAGGTTAMGEGMADANDLLIDGRSDTRKVMIVLTDGETNTGDDRDGSNAIDIANANDITIYTIGLGSSLDEALLRHIASETGGAYYNAPDSSDLSEIYNTIAQELSDYDISEVEYGVQGFTQYDYTFEDTLSDVSSDSFEDTFLINETINDLKVQLDWTGSSDLNLQLTSPSGEVYGLNDNSTGYYPTDNSEYIWIQPLSYLYPDNDADNVETGYWTLRVTGSGSGSVDFTITTYIDKKSAAKLSSHAFISSFDESRGDNAGLGLYSFEDVVLTDSQTSYVLDNSTWVGYFTPQSDAYYTLNVSWDDASLMDVYLYDGIDVVSSSNGTGCCEVSHRLSADETYYVDVVKGAGSGTDTRFTINVITSESDTIMTAYYESSGGGGTPKSRTWDGFEWSSEQSANYVGGSPYYVILESSPLGSEVIMATSDNNLDVNVQIWDGSSWGSVEEFTRNLDSYSKRGFDLKYEQVSGDAVIAYMDMNINDGVPRYRIWNGNSWSSANAVDSSNQGAGDVGWVRLEANPNSDEMILVTLDDQRDISAQVWDGSSWGNSVSLTGNARASSYQCFDVSYEQETGRAIVSWADYGTGNVMYRIWDGSSWSSQFNLYHPNARVYWIKMASDPNSNNILLAAQDNDNDISVTAWDGSSWSSVHEIETHVYEYNKRSVDVAFEQSGGTGLVAWGSSSSTPRYCTWDGSSWSSVSDASGLGGSGYTQWVQLTPDPDSDDIFLMTSDGNNYYYSDYYDDLNIQVWDGSSWGIVSEVETSSTRYYECFDITFNDVDSPATSTAVLWNEWTASVTSTLENDSLSHLENAIDTITADGLTAIDEGLFVANNELSSVDGNSTIVIMTDGLDNSGYHSLLQEAYKARDNNTVIYTVGFGNDESEVDPMLEEIATITGGEYYFAPNSSVLKDIFRGIASQITNFSADGPSLAIDIPYNYISSSSVAKASYILNSSNSTIGDNTAFDVPTAPSLGNAEPDITISGNKSILKWQLPNMGAGDKWGIWYQMRVDGAGYVPIILPTSTVTYTDLGGENITVYVPSSSGASIGSSGSASVLSYSLGSLELEPDKTIMPIAGKTNIKLTLSDITGNSSFAYVYLYSSIGYFGDYENPINVTVVGSDNVVFSSNAAGKAVITAYAYNVNDESDVLVSKETLFVRPKGSINIC